MSLIPRAVATAFVLCLLASAAGARVSAPFLVENVSDERIASNAVEEVVSLGDRAVFTTANLVGVTDGTPGGTEIVLQSFGASPDPEILAVVPGVRVYFRVASDLWATDGTGAGTVQLTRDGIFAGEVPQTYVQPSTGDLYAVLGDDGDFALWRSDGTEAGTFELITGSRFDLGAEVGGRVLFVVQAAPETFPTQAELWAADGTVHGVEPLTEFGADGVVGEVEPALGEAVFTVHRSGAPSELWRTDGTAGGTRFVWRADEELDRITQLVGTPGRVYMTVEFFSDVLIDSEFWASDGTEEGTVQVLTMVGRPVVLTTVGDRILFLPFTYDFGEEPFVSDGTAAGTYLLADIVPGFDFGYVQLVGVGPDVVYLSADDGVIGRELYATDLNDLTLVTDLCAGPCSSDPEALGLDGDRLYFFADTRLGGEEIFTVAPGDAVRPLTGFEPLHPFATRAGARVGDRLVFATADVGGVALRGISTDPLPPSGNPSPQVLYDFDLFVEEASSGPGGFSHRGETLFFTAFDTPDSLSLYRRPRNGPSERIGLLSDATRDPGGTPSADAVTAVVPGGVFALVPHGILGHRLWFSDGTPGGALRLIDDSAVGDLQVDLTPIRDGVLYQRRPGLELRFSDGTASGTTTLHETVLSPVELFDGRAYFGIPGGFGVTDGTVSGTEVAFDLSAQGVTLGEALLATETHLFLVARTEGGVRYFALDGTGGELTPLGDFAGRHIHFLAGRNGEAYATAFDDGLSGHLIHLSADAATVTDLGAPFRSFVAGPATTSAAFLGDVLYAVRDDGFVVRSDGTPEGTFESPLLPPGEPFQGRLVALPGDRLLYVQGWTLTPVLTYRLWVTDGTASGTRLLGPLEKLGHELHLVGDRVYFAAQGEPPERSVGVELWAVSLTAPPTAARPAPLMPGVCEPERGELCW